MGVTRSIKNLFLTTAVVCASNTAFAQTIDNTHTYSTSEQFLSDIATSSGTYLKQIAENTYHILEKVNNLPNYLEALSEYTVSWLSNDTAEDSYISKTQQNFSTLGFRYSQNAVIDSNFVTRLTADLLGKKVEELTEPGDRPQILDTLNNINSLSYTSVLNRPPVANGPVDFYEYVRSASGASIPHQIPNKSWAGDPNAISAYYGIYYTTLATTSFSAYTLANLLTEQHDGNTPTLRSELQRQASSSDWLAQVASEELGKVLRHILLFESQNYVTQNELLKVNKDILISQIMTNAMITALGQSTEISVRENASKNPQIG